MDSGTTIIGVIVTLLCILPFIIYSRNSAKKRKANFQAMIDLAHSKNYIITKKDDWKQHVIGIDELAKILFFSNDPTNPDSYKMIDLKEVQDCNLIKDNSNDVLKRLALEMEYSDQSIVSLEFYNADKSMGVINEFELVMKWYDIVSDNLNN